MTGSINAEGRMQNAGPKSNPHQEKFLHSAFLLLRCLFERPIIASIRMAMAMCRKKAAAMKPEPGPDLLTISLGNFQRGQRLPGKELKPAFGVGRRQRSQPCFHFEQKHQPMRLA